MTSKTMKEQKTPAMRPMASADMGCTNPEAGVMATKPATAPEIAPKAVGLPLWIHSATVQPSARGGSGKVGIDEGAGRQRSGIQGAARVEAEPTHPQQAGTDEAEHQRVRRHHRFGIADALAKINGGDPGPRRLR